MTETYVDVPLTEIRVGDEVKVDGYGSQEGGEVKREGITLKKSVRVELPMLPNFLKVGESSESIACFSDPELKALGRAWTWALLAHARKMRENLKTPEKLAALKAFERAVEYAADSLMITTAEAEAAKKKARAEYNALPDKPKGGVK